jgi:hypothetical protein
MSSLPYTSLLSFIHSWSWVLLEKLPIVQPLKNFPEFYGTQRFITVFTRALHWSLSWVRSIQSIPPHLYKIYLNIVHPPTSWSSQWSISFWFSHQYPTCIHLRPIPATCPAHLMLLDFIILIMFGKEPQVMKLLIMQLWQSYHGA